MDWGLLEMKSGDNKFLREETVYSSNVGHNRIIVNLMLDPFFNCISQVFYSWHSSKKYLCCLPRLQFYWHKQNCIIRAQCYVDAFQNACIICLEILFNATIYLPFYFQLFYYFGMVEDLILRFGWTLSMSLVKAGYIEGELMMTILSPFEVFRRFMWNYFRLENEHLNNCGKFRAVRDISVAPMDCSDQVRFYTIMSLH